MSFSRNKRFFLGLGVILLATSGCGKALHVSMAGTQAAGDKKATDTKSTDTKVPGDKVGGADKKQVDPKTASTDLADGRIGPISQFDQTHLPALPFLNAQDAAGYPYYYPGLGESIPNLVDDKGAVIKDDKGNPTVVQVVPHADFLFRSLITMPAEGTTPKVTSFLLHLRGLRRHLAEGEKGTALDKQILCIVDTKICSGEKPEATDAEKANLNPKFWADDAAPVTMVNDKFAKTKMEQIIATDDKGSVITTKAHKAVDNDLPDGEEMYDMRDLFDLGMDDAKVLKWVLDNTQPYAPGVRKMRFVIGNNTYISEGDVILDVAPATVAIANDEKLVLVNGNSDRIGATLPTASDDNGDNDKTDDKDPTDPNERQLKIKNKITTPELVPHTAGAPATITDAPKPVTIAPVVITNNGGDQPKTDLKLPVLAYGDHFNLTKDATLSSPIAGILSGGAITKCTVTPSLPTGLTFNEKTCEISGTPKVVSDASYVIQTANDAGLSNPVTTQITITEITENTKTAVNINLGEGTVLFAFDSDTLHQVSGDLLTKLGAVLKNNADSIQTVLVTGKTSRMGSDARNTELARFRADKVRDRLIAAGLSNTQVFSVGRGPVTQEESVKAGCKAEDTDCAKDRHVKLQVVLKTSLTDDQQNAIAAKLNSSISALTAQAENEMTASHARAATKRSKAAAAKAKANKNK